MIDWALCVNDQTDLALMKRYRVKQHHTTAHEVFVLTGYQQQSKTPVAIDYQCFNVNVLERVLDINGNSRVLCQIYNTKVFS